MIHTHVVHMTRPHFHEVAKNDRVVSFGNHLIRETGVLNLDLARHLILLKHELLCRLQREVELLLEQLHTIHLHSDLVALRTHDRRQIILHLINESHLLFGEVAGNFRKDIRGNLMGICSVHLVLEDFTALLFIGLDVTVKHEATESQVIVRLLTFGISIQR